MKIDVHAHFFPRITREQGAVLGADGPWLRDDGDGTGQLMAGEREYRSVESLLWDPDVRGARMDEHGVDIQVLSATPLLFGYGADPETAGRWCRLVNDQAVEMCAVHPERLRPLCQVPLQDVDLACVEASRAVADGHVGVHIGNHLADRNLDDPDMVQFLHHCADESIPVLVHPWDMMAADRMPGYMLQWLVSGTFQRRQELCRRDDKELPFWTRVLAISICERSINIVSTPSNIGSGFITIPGPPPN